MNGTIPPYTAAAVEALTAAHAEEHDFAGWLAGVLAAAAARAGGTEELLAGRPGSWEAADLRHLLQGTVGAGDEFLGQYADRGGT